LQKEFNMTSIVYEIVRHDGGWAYKLGNTLSETYAHREDAFEGAKSAASRQKVDMQDVDVREQGLQDR
jgi:hypothetical protein